jgi:hypothetical protein
MHQRRSCLQPAPQHRPRSRGGGKAAAATSARQQLEVLRAALPTVDDPAALAALVERACDAMRPELPGVRAAFVQVAAAAAPGGAPRAAARGGFGVGPTGGGGRASPWGGITGSGRAAGAAAAAYPPPGSSGSSSSSGASSSGGGSGTAEVWSWERVRHLHAYGLGSLSEYVVRTGGGSGDAGADGTPKRAGMRLAQWALLLLLQRDLLPGLQANKPWASDPAFSAFDLEALRLLGVEGHSSDALLR